MEKRKHKVCYCAGRAECHNCYWVFGDYGEELTQEQIEEIEKIECKTN